MVELRAFEGGLVMHEAVVHGQPFTYHSPHSMETLLQPGYWIGLARRFQVGDTMLLVSLRQNGGDSRVVSLATCIVSAVSRETGVELFPYIGPIEVPGEQADAPAPAPESRLLYATDGWSARFSPRAGWRVQDGAGEVMIRGLDERQAKAVAGGHVGLSKDDAGAYALVDPDNFLAQGDATEAA